MRIGFYTHHHGSGHLRRALTIAEELASRGHATSIASSRASAGVDVALPLDNEPGPGDTGFPDPDAHGAFHWAPAHNPGLSARMARLAQWVTEFRPDVVHVDVSVEVAVFLRLLGVPVTVQAMPGVRDDAPHQLAYRLAAGIIAAWPDWVPLNAGLAPHADRVHRVGGISRFPSTGRETNAAFREAGTRHIVVLRGAGGHAYGDQFWEETAAQVPDTAWRILGGKDTVADPSPLLRAADLVISAAGQNSVADIAACGAPAIVTAEQRPFGEQEATAQVLRQAGLTSSAPATETDWPEAIAHALARPSDQVSWEKWQTRGAASRAADALERAGK